jgi:hypothetical protein
VRILVGDVLPTSLRELLLVVEISDPWDAESLIREKFPAGMEALA